MNFNADLSCILVIFGGTGDLAHRKLIPAIYNLFHDNLLPENFAVVSIGRREICNEEYRDQLRSSIEEFSRLKIEDKIWNIIEDRIYYCKFSFNDDNGYTSLKYFLSELDDKYGTKGNRIYYLAVAPEYFEIISDKLYKNAMTENANSWKRIVIEKPFGKDLKSAQYLNKRITDVFDEKNIYRIDHYLGKEMIQNIMIIRFANSIFEPLWNSKYIDNVQITSSETVGVENRGGYYDRAGALKDMIQNHMLQLLTLTAMEPPSSINSEHIRNEKIKVLQSLEKLTPEYIQKNVIRGQYGKGIINGKFTVAYREENNVSVESNTETFVALKMYIQNFRWAGVPFYIRSGKRMKEKSTEIIVEFKNLPNILYFKEQGTLKPNILIIKVNPMEGIIFQFNGKKLGTKDKIIPLSMNFCQNCGVETNSPEAYERLLLDIMKGDSTLFTSWDEVEYSWKFVDTILNTWKISSIKFPNYEAGSYGPKEAEYLLAMNNKKWYNLDSNDICTNI